MKRVEFVDDIPFVSSGQMLIINQYGGLNINIDGREMISFSRDAVELLIKFGKLKPIPERKTLELRLFDEGQKFITAEEGFYKHMASESIADRLERFDERKEFLKERFSRNNYDEMIYEELSNQYRQAISEP